MKIEFDDPNASNDTSDEQPTPSEPATPPPAEEPSDLPELIQPMYLRGAEDGGRVERGITFDKGIERGINFDKGIDPSSSESD